MSEVLIRYATADDAGLIADFSRGAFYSTFAAQNTRENMGKFLAEEFSTEALVLEVLDAENIFFMAFEEDKLLGYVKMRQSAPQSEPADADAIEIARIYVDATLIRKGIGSILMNEAERIAKNMNKNMIWLGVWEHNQRAIDFYKARGFEKFSTQPFKLGDDIQTDWLMNKRLV